MKYKTKKRIRLPGIMLAASAIILGGCTITDFTSSTSDTIDKATPDVTLNRFVNSRFASIQEEAANGQGENLDTLAYMLGEPNRPAFEGWMQAHYGDLFTGLGKPSDLVSRIRVQQTKTPI